MRLQEIMNAKVETISDRETGEAARERMRLRGIQHLLVLSGGKASGVLSVRDLDREEAAGKRVAELMTPHIITASPRTTVREAANLLRGHAIGCLPVIEKGKLKGIVTVSDLLELIGRGSQRLTARTEHPEIRYHHRNKKVARSRKAGAS